VFFHLLSPALYNCFVPCADTRQSGKTGTNLALAETSFRSLKSAFILPVTNHPHHIWSVRHDDDTVSFFEQSVDGGLEIIHL